MAGSGDVNGIQVELLYHSVYMDVNEIQPGSRSPMAQQARLHVLDLQRLPQKRIRHQVNLTHREVIGRAPISIHFGLFVATQDVSRSDDFDGTWNLRNGHWILLLELCRDLRRNATPR